MDWKQFIASLIGHLAWPLAILLLFVLFRLGGDIWRCASGVGVWIADSGLQVLSLDTIPCGAQNSSQPYCQEGKPPDLQLETSQDRKRRVAVFALLVDME
jgi:hypothetical protein